MSTWLITGASSGLGREVAERLLGRGDRVVAMVRRPEVLDDLRARHDDRLDVLALDLEDAAAIGPAVDRAFEVGRIDVVFSNAGYGLFGAVEEVGEAEIGRQIATNLTGSILFVRACLPHLRRQGGGRVLQSSSEGGQTTYPGFGIYHATKWGIEGFIEAAAEEVAPFGIDMVIVEPGPTRTRFSANAVRVAAMPDYAGTPVARIREALSSGTFADFSDAARCAAAIVACADAERPPRRLVLGRTAYANIERRLAERLTAVRAQEEAAHAVDRQVGEG